jgi:hypothetical protein
LREKSLQPQKKSLEIQQVEEAAVIEETQIESTEVPLEPATVSNGPIAEQPTETTTSPTQVKTRSIFDNRAATDLKALNQQKLDRMATQAAQDFQHNKVHPEIETNYTGPPEVSGIEEKRYLAELQFRKNNRVSIDCNRTGGKVLSFISGISCKQLPPFQSFIEKRVNKTDMERDK